MQYFIKLQIDHHLIDCMPLEAGSAGLGLSEFGLTRSKNAPVRIEIVQEELHVSVSSEAQIDIVLTRNGRVRRLMAGQSVRLLVRDTLQIGGRTIRIDAVYKKQSTRSVRRTLKKASCAAMMTLAASMALTACTKMTPIEHPSESSVLPQSYKDCSIHSNDPESIKACCQNIENAEDRINCCDQLSDEYDDVACDLMPEDSTTVVQRTSGFLRFGIVEHSPEEFKNLFITPYGECKRHVDDNAEELKTCCETQDNELKRNLCYRKLAQAHPDTIKSVKNTGNVQPEETYFLKNDAIPGNAREYFKGFAKNEAEVDAMLEHLARLYQNSGKIDESNQIYNDLITANPGDFKIVGYQYEIMLNTETLGDPIVLFDSIQHTAGIFVKARDEHYIGATPEAVKKENDKLQTYISYTGKRYHTTSNKTSNPRYRSLAFEIYKTYLESFPDAPDNYEITYYYADMAYLRENYAESAKGYERVLDLNEKGLVPKSEESDEILKDSANGAVYAYDKLMGESNTDKEACPDIPKMEITEEQTYPEIPIPACRLNFIKAAQRYVKLAPLSENVQNMKYKTAEIYFNYNHFDEARPLFQEIIQDSPKSEAAVYSANNQLETYRLTKQYSEMRALLSDLKGNSEFMANNTSLMPELINFMNNYEEALDYKFCEDRESEQRWEEAARCYEEFAVNHKDSEAAEKARSKASAARKQSAK